AELRDPPEELRADARRLELPLEHPHLPLELRLLWIERWVSWRPAHPSRLETPDHALEELIAKPVRPGLPGPQALRSPPARPPRARRRGPPGGGSRRKARPPGPAKSTLGRYSSLIP